MSNEFNDDVLKAVKHGSFIRVSDEILMDQGLIPDTRPPAPRWSRRRRLSWWWAERRERLGEWVAGRRFDEDPL